MSNANHIITTDNDFMKAIGLSAFTTGDLYTWITENDGENLGYLKFSDPSLVSTLESSFSTLSDKDILDGKAIAAFPIMDILLGEIGHTGNNNIEDEYYFTVWRKKERNSVDEKFTWVTDDSHSNWDIVVDQTPYTDSDLELNNSDINQTTRPDGVLNYKNVTISAIIEMNDLVTQQGYLDDNPSDTEIARSRFIRDIKRSEEGGLCWESPDNSIVWLNVNGDEIPQSVEFKLLLFGSNNPKPTKRFSATNANSTFAVIPKTSTGRSGGVDKTGRPIAANGQVAGELDLSVNPVTGKLQSGTRQIIAVMETDLLPAIAPDGGLLSSPSDYINTTTGFGPTTGSARPITMNASNIHSWGPSYKYGQGGTAEEDDEIESVPVQNKLTNSTFASGQTVILNEIEGVWQPLATQSSEPSEPPPAEVQVGGWDFMYLVSNADHYFRPAGPLGSTLKFNGPIGREALFYDYYYGVRLHPNGNVTDNPGSTEPFNNCVQLTSWDFMGPNVGGLRSTHALGQTQFNRDVNGDTVDNDFYRKAAQETAPFFGCVFPNGYNTGSKYALYNNVGTPMATSGVNASSYIADINDSTIIFQQGLTSHIYGYDIFADVRDDSTLHQLPADIALNADPDSIIGAPLTILAGLEYAFSDLPGSPDTPQNRVANFLSNTLDIRHAWLTDAAGEPTFEFQPLTRGNVQFRPLKTEVYASFEGLAPLTAAGRGEYGHRGHTISPGGPISIAALTRVPAGGVIGPLAGLGVNGFQYNVDIYGSNNVLTTQGAHPENHWRRDWNDKDHSAGAVGIIGASCVITANQAINFKTQCNYGVQARNTPAVPPLIKRAWYDQFGGTGHDYDDFHDTVLYARIYHHWPRKQTVYDPRFFAVYHFSAGAGDISIPVKYYYNGSVILEAEYTASTEPISYPDGRYIVQQIPEEYEGTDFREPTVAGLSEYGTLATAGLQVWEDGGTTAGVNIVLPWRDHEDWMVNIGARGKLLPISANAVPMLDIGIGNSSLHYLDTTGGTGYKIEDQFTTERGHGTGVVIEVTDVEVSTDPAIDGRVIALTVINQGTGFLPEDFFPSTDPDPIQNHATVTLKPLSVNGTGFAGFVKYGEVIETSTGKAIEKPQGVDANLINTDQNQAPAVQLSKRYEPKDGVEDKPPTPIDEEVEASIPITNKSSDNKYDLFLHFHNDISHNFAWNGWTTNHDEAPGFDGNFLGTPEQIFEQAIDLTISPI